ncbi:MAG TPA: nickel transporter [Candidatus Eisenbacteria bacterium]|nr:nickel transporter [Candidatus Eisenbacteria bacterium]
MSLPFAPLAMAAAAGLGAGLLHTWTGPDHLAALSPLAVSRGRRAWGLGVRWGIGHSAGALVLAGLGLWARESLKIDVVSHWGERVVGVSLVALGLWALWRARRTHLHSHRHAHEGGEPHVHVHAHAPGRGHEPAAAVAVPHHVHGHAALGFGFLHGVAGGSHLWAALPALALPMGGAVAYLGGFAAGCIAAMGAYAGVLGVALERFPDRAGVLHRRVLTGAAGLAIGVGVWWLAGGAI